MIDLFLFASHGGSPCCTNNSENTYATPVWTELLLDAILLSSLPLLCKQSRSYCHRYYSALAHMLHCWNFTCQAKKPLMSPRCIKIIVAIALVTAAVVIPVLLLLGKRSDTGSLSAGILFPCSFFGELLFKPNHLGIVVFEEVRQVGVFSIFFLSSLSLFFFYFVSKNTE